MRASFSHIVLSMALVTAPACGDDDGTSGGGSEGGAGQGGGGQGGGEGGSINRDFVAGGDRPVNVMVSPDYDPEVPAPLVILLHGYAVAGGVQDAYWEVSDAVLARGGVFAAPDGTVDSDSRRFWNATDACCNFDGSTVDDGAYLIGLIDEISATVAIDPTRVYFAGHSNGGFMSHRMACDHADRVTAIASVAGANHLDPTDCAASEPVNVLQIHGTEDETIHYDGGTNIGNEYPSAAATVATWVDLNGCDAEPIDGDPVDIEFALEGNETTVESWPGCDEGVAVELWSIQGGSHIPSVYDTFGATLVAWLFAKQK